MGGLAYGSGLVAGVTLFLDAFARGHGAAWPWWVSAGLAGVSFAVALWAYAWKTPT